jgi:hypothetical protein
MCLHGPHTWVELLAYDGSRVKWRMFSGLPVEQRISIREDEKGPFIAIETNHY